MEKLPIGATTWSGGFWGKRFKGCKNLMIPSQEEALLNSENSAYLGNFARVAGLEQGGHVGTQWSDGDCYKWLESVSHVFGVTKNQELKAKLDYYIAHIAAAQETSGYINTYNQLHKKTPWSWYRDHEIYNFGHLFTAAAVHFRATGEQAFLQVAIQAADYLYSVFADSPKELAHFGFNPTNIMGLVDLYRVTDNEKYLQLADIFIGMRGSVKGGDDLNQDRVPFRDETEAVGHAVLANYLYCGAVDVYSHTGDTKLKAAIDRVYESAVRKKTYITGAQGAYYHGLSSRLDPIEEAFGHDYELPNRVAYTETCANIANGMFNLRLLELTGNAQYGDMLEQVLYNSGLSGGNVEGTRFYYNNPLSRRGDGYINLGGTNITDNSAVERWYIHQCYCCPTSYVRTVAQVHEWAYGKSDNALWVHLYGEGSCKAELASGNLALDIQTNYPWDGEIAISVTEAPVKPCTLFLRIPKWCKNPTLEVNGVTQSVQAGTYHEITQHFAMGDKVVLHLPMEVCFMVANPLVEEASGLVALMRGPVVYCLEGCDVPSSTTVDSLYLIRNATYTPQYEETLLGGVVTITTVAKSLPSIDTEQLYTELPEYTENLVPIRLIPYYAWSNRGVCDMSVWLKMYH